MHSRNSITIKGVPRLIVCSNHAEGPQAIVPNLSGRPRMVKEERIGARLPGPVGGLDRGGGGSGKKQNHNSIGTPISSE